MFLKNSKIFVPDTHFNIFFLSQISNNNVHMMWFFWSFQHCCVFISQIIFLIPLNWQFFLKRQKKLWNWLSFFVVLILSNESLDFCSGGRASIRDFALFDITGHSTQFGSPGKFKFGRGWCHFFVFREQSQDNIFFGFGKLIGG